MSTTIKGGYTINKFGQPQNAHGQPIDAPKGEAEPDAENGIDATDSAAELAAEHGIDLASVEGSGAGGRIVKSDVEALID